MSEGNGHAKAVDTRFRRLEAHEVMMAWDMLFYAIKRSEIYTDDVQIANLLMDCSRASQCWIFKDGEGLKAVICTKMFMFLDRKYLMVTHANSFDGGVDDDGWRLILGKLLQFGHGEKCQGIEVFSENPRLRAIMLGLGFEEMKFFRKEITCHQEAEPAAK